MKTILFGALVIAGIGSASAQSVPRDKPDAHAVDTAKVATVEQWSKRRGSKVIWSQDPQQLPKTSADDSRARVDAAEVETVDEQSKERGHRQVWFKYPEKRSHAVAVNRTAAAAPVAKKKAPAAKPAEPRDKTDPATTP